MMMIPLSRRFHNLHGFFRRILVAPLKITRKLYPRHDKKPCLSLRTQSDQHPCLFYLHRKTRKTLIFMCFPCF